MGVSYRVFPQGPSIEGESPSLRGLGHLLPTNKMTSHMLSMLVEVGHGHGGLWLSSIYFHFVSKGHK